MVVLQKMMKMVPFFQEWQSAKTLHVWVCCSKYDRGDCRPKLVAKTGQADTDSVLQRIRHFQVLLLSINYFVIYLVIRVFPLWIHSTCSHFGAWGWFLSFLITFTNGRPPWTGDQLVARPLPKHRTTRTQNKRVHTPNFHVLCGIRTHDPGFRASEDSSCLRALGYRDRLPPMSHLV
jgi:hypothetical protein